MPFKTAAFIGFGNNHLILFCDKKIFPKNETTHKSSSHKKAEGPAEVTSLSADFGGGVQNAHIRHLRDLFPSHRLSFAIFVSWTKWIMTPTLECTSHLLPYTAGTNDPLEKRSRKHFSFISPTLSAICIVQWLETVNQSKMMLEQNDC